MIILGIDPGSIKAGFAIIEYKNRKHSYVNSGVLRYGHIKNFIERPGLIFESIKELFEKYNPDEVAIESLIYVKGTTSMLKLAQARGAMLAAMNIYKQGKIFEYSPNAVKSAVSGHGHAGKEGIQKTINMIFRGIEFKTDDESDAIAIALTHTLTNRKLIVDSKMKMKSKGTRLRDLRN